MEDLFSDVETIEQSQYGRAVAPPAQARHDNPAPSVEAAARMNRTGKTARDQAKVPDDDVAPAMTTADMFAPKGQP